MRASTYISHYICVASLSDITALCRLPNRKAAALWYLVRLNRILRYPVVAPWSNI